MDFLNELPEGMGRRIAGFLDVATLVEKKIVCRSWRALFTTTIEQKTSTPQAFESPLKSIHNTTTMMQKISQQHMDGLSGGGMFRMLRILNPFLKTVSFSTRALDRGMSPTLHQWNICFMMHHHLTKIFRLGTP
jgi:hypothetical protein